RHDITNDTDDYQRNYVRHHITPSFFELNNQFDQAFRTTINHLESDRRLISDYVDSLILEVSSKQGDIVYFNVEKLKNPKIKKAFFHIFSPYGFMTPNEIEKLLDANNSAEITSEQYRLIKDRESIILAPLNQKKINYKIDGLNTDSLPVDFKLIKSNYRKNNGISFDFNKIKFPLSLRIHKSGDKFYPKGMNGKSKKISKFYKDIKLSKLEKENTWLLCDANDNIIWVVNHRQDERFIPTKNTKIWLIVEN
ncbi:MAG: tRNA lysidine(34) synthetase TilS, partial [Weeksellaceae bacterium]